MKGKKQSNTNKKYQAFSDPFQKAPIANFLSLGIKLFHLTISAQLRMKTDKFEINCTLNLEEDLPHEKAFFSSFFSKAEEFRMSNLVLSCHASFSAIMIICH